MATHGVVILSDSMSYNLDSLNRSAYSASDIDNGYVFQLNSENTSSGSGELWLATWPVTGSLAGLWMANSPEVPLTVDGALIYRGLNQDPRKFYTPAGRAIDAFKPMPGDVIIASSAVFSNTYTAGSFVTAVDSSFQLQFTSNSAGTGALLFRTQGATYISIGSGAIDNQRITAFKIECIANS